MEVLVTQDQAGTHIDWDRDGVTPRMIDWFWSNMEKANLLWHPEQHEPLEWYVRPKHGNILGSVHIAPQTWNDGTRQNLYIKTQDPRELPRKFTDLIVYSHCYIAGGYTQDTIDEGQPMGYRIHQWQGSDAGVVGRSSAIPGLKKETPEEGLIWADHCKQEIGNWGVFLPQLYKLYRVVTNTLHNPFCDLTIERTEAGVRYKEILSTKEEQQS